jgi:hypothetical protein
VTRVSPKISIERFNATIKPRAIMDALEWIDTEKVVVEQLSDPGFEYGVAQPL